MPNIQKTLQNIRNLHLRISYTLILCLQARLKKEDEVTVNIDDTSVRENIYIIDIICVGQKHCYQQDQHNRTHDQPPIRLYTARKITSCRCNKRNWQNNEEQQHRKR